MPRRTLLTPSERADLLAFPENPDDLIRHYTFNELDLSLIRQRRGDANRLGFAVQLSLLRYPGYALASDTDIPQPMLQWITQQVRSDIAAWPQYAQREETRYEHFYELRTYLGLEPFGLSSFRILVRELADLAMQTDKGLVLASHALDKLRKQRIILPAVTVVERACAEALTQANRRIYRALNEPLHDYHRIGLDQLLTVRADGQLTWLAWLRQTPFKPNSRSILEHIERLKVFQTLRLPEGIGRDIHQNRLLKMAREGAHMTPHDLGKFEPQRRYATLVAIVIEGAATVIDEVIDLHDRVMMKVFSAARKKHQQDFQNQGKAINEKVRLYMQVGRAIVQAKQSGQDPYVAIEAVLPWEEFERSLTEASKLAQAQSFDHLHLVSEHYSMLRRYTPALLDVLQLKAAPAAQDVLDAISMMKKLNDTNTRQMPGDAPVDFIRQRWKALVFGDEGDIDRKFYEICALAELKNALRSGDIWVQGSRQFKDFDEYLLPADKFAEIKAAQALPLAIETDSNQYLHDRLQLLTQQLAKVNRLAQADKLPDAVLTASGLKITPLDTVVPDTAQTLITLASEMLPRIKITELLMEVDDWTGFTRHFTHLKSGDEASDKTLLLSAILATSLACAG